MYIYLSTYIYIYIYNIYIYVYSHFRCRNIDPILISAHLQPSVAPSTRHSAAPASMGIHGPRLHISHQLGTVRSQVGHDPRVKNLGIPKRFISLYHIGFSFHVWEPPPWVVLQRNTSVNLSQPGWPLGLASARTHGNTRGTSIRRRGPEISDGADCGYSWYTPELTMRGTRSYVCWFIIVGL